MNLKEFRNKYSKRTPVVAGTPNHFGWNSNSEVFNLIIEEVQPKSIIEVGSWFGQSAIHMAETMEEPNILCVDVWLPTHNLTWGNHDPFDVTVKFDSVYQQFCINITDKDLNDYISPLPMTSTSAAAVLSNLGVAADIIYLDAGHTKRDVYSDLEDWWGLANSALIGDDYSPDWPGVIEAADQFSQEMDIHMEAMDRKFVLWK